ncbi:MAG: YbaN family protein [Tissierellia bacterium]|nr:YbaN family protein [Tissierellia bacterium]
MKKLVLKIIGGLALALGSLGLFLPLLPTTPFLLLAAWDFLNSSQSLYHWLINHRIFGLYIRTYLTFKGVSRSHKILALATLWPTMALSIYLVNPWPLKVLLATIALLVSRHLLRLKTLTKAEMKALEEGPAFPGASSP